jgi:hypothetical protein
VKFLGSWKERSKVVLTVSRGTIGSRAKNMEPQSHNLQEISSRSTAWLQDSKGLGEVVTMHFLPFVSPTDATSRYYN